MKKKLKILGGLVVAALLAFNGYCTYHNWVVLTHARKVVNADYEWAAHERDYSHAAIECLLQIHGQTENDLNRIEKGQTVEQARQEWSKEWGKAPEVRNPFNKREIYEDQIPECHVFFSQYRCWALDPHDPKSLDGCGKRFGLLQSEIDQMKTDPSSIKKIMDEAWNRKDEEVKAKKGN